MTNTGTIEALSTGDFASIGFEGGTIINTGGTMLASGADGSILFDGVSLTGGALKTSGNAAIIFGDSNTITGVTNTGQMFLQPQCPRHPSRAPRSTIPRPAM